MKNIKNIKDIKNIKIKIFVILLILAALIWMFKSCGSNKFLMDRDSESSLTEISSSENESSKEKSTTDGREKDESTKGESVTDSADETSGSAESDPFESSDEPQSDSPGSSGGSGGSSGNPGEPSNENPPVSSNIQALLNAAPLTPMPTRNQETDSRIREIIGSGGSTYDKLIRGYDWLVRNMTYTSGRIIDVTDGSRFLPDSRPAYYGEYGNFFTSYLVMGYTALMEAKGVCDNYSCAFVLMARSIGLEAYVYTGDVRSKAGGYTAHAWAGIILNGTVYVFDPNVEQNNLGAGGEITYYYFGKTAAQMSSLYLWDDVSGYSTIFGTENIINYYKNRNSRWEYVIDSVDDIIRMVNEDPLNMRSGYFILTGLLLKEEVDETLNGYYNVPFREEYIGKQEAAVKQKAYEWLTAHADRYKYTDIPVNPDMKLSDLTIKSIYVKLRPYSGFGINPPCMISFISEYYGIIVSDAVTGYEYDISNMTAPEVLWEL